MNRHLALRGMLSGIGALAGMRSAVADTSTVRIATVHTEQGAAAIYADQMGFFKRAGVNVEVDLLDSGAAIVSALAGGAMDVGAVNPVSLAVAHEHGAAIVAFAPTAYYDSNSRDSLLLVAANSPIRTAKDLEGKTIATTGLKNTPQFATEAWIDRNGGDSKTAKFLELPYSAMPAALSEGRVDAAFCAEPVLSTAKSVTRVLADPYSAVAPRFLTGLYCVRTEYARQNPALIRRLSEALRATAVWANSHPKETADILVRVEKFNPSIVSTMTRAEFGTRLLPQEMQPPIDLAARYGLLSAPISAQSLIWPTR